MDTGFVSRGRMSPVFRDPKPGLLPTSNILVFLYMIRTTSLVVWLQIGSVAYLILSSVQRDKRSCLQMPVELVHEYSGSITNSNSSDL